MKKSVLLILVGFYGLMANAQKSTIDKRFNQDWELAATWNIVPTAGVPNYTNMGSANLDYDIYGYTRLGSSSISRNLDFAGGHPTLTFTVNDTLVVFGNMTFGNDAMTLKVPAGGLLIVMGTLDVDNKVDISAGGNIVVKGQFKLTGSQADVTVTGAGAFYAGSYNNGASAEVPDASELGMAELKSKLLSVWKFVNGLGVNPLPVELISFTGNANNGKVNLSWTTASELNFDYFEVERADNPKEFKGIGKVTGHGTSSIRHDYSLTDEMPLVGKNYYRLKSVDVDGHFEYSKLVAVDFSADKVFSIYPNPSDGSSLNFSLNFVPGVNSSIIVLDNIGNVVGMYKPSDYSQGISFTNQLKGGVYYAKIFSDDFVKVERFVVR